MALYFIPKYQKVNKRNPTIVLSKDDAANIDASSNLSEQMQRLTSLLEIPEEEGRDRAATCGEMLQVLRKYYPNASLTPFGSSVTSFGIRGSDLHLLFLPFPSYCNLDYPREETSIPDPASVLSGEVASSALDKFHEYKHLKFIRVVLRHEKITRKASLLPRGPILKVMPTGKVTCNISASNRLVVFNSELLATFGKLDVRVRPLVMCLRYWAKSLGFIKRSFFSNYSFTLLVIFFLQTLPSPVLPSVRRLFEKSGTSRMTAGWQTAFAADVQNIPKSRNTLTLGELFIQFFDFYFHFDFLRYVVSPHHGKPLLLDDIKNSKDERMAQFEISRLNIQDVFILSRNVCPVEKLAVFKLALLTAHQMLKEKATEFHSLFDPNAYQQVLDKHYLWCPGSRSVVSFINLDYECSKKFNSIQTWFEKALETVYEVLQCGLLMECEVTDKVYKIGSLPKQQVKSDPDRASTPYDLELLVSIQCMLYSKIWIGRKNAQATSTDDPEVVPDSVLGNEHCISRSLVENNPTLSSHVPVLCFECECYRHASPELRDLVLILKPITFSKEFFQVSAFLASFLPKTVKKILMSS